jgi:aminopeptidase YwaD
MGVLAQRVASYLHLLCEELPGRAVGSAGNRAATAWFAQQIKGFGFAVETPEFECLDWSHNGAELRLAGRTLPMEPSPYSLGCSCRARLAVADTLESLELAEVEGAILLLRGTLVKEQLMPKNFPFYNPSDHRALVGSLESKQPVAILAATGRDPGMAGGVSPFPLIEDGDFTIPCAHMTEAAGVELAACEGETLELTIRAKRTPAIGCNVEAHKGSETGARIVAFAHIDAKPGTPGALDNAAGVSVLLLLAELMQPHIPKVRLELIALNGEDYYSAPGEQLFLRRNADRFDDILLGINIDGAGDAAGDMAFSLYGCPPPIEQAIRKSFLACPGMIEGEPWVQSDHSLFLMHARPALAVTSARFSELWAEIAHTPNDLPERVSPQRLEDLAHVLLEIVLELGAAGVGVRGRVSANG